MPREKFKTVHYGRPCQSTTGKHFTLESHDDTSCHRQDHIVPLKITHNV